jgi:hypothetical protein
MSGLSYLFYTVFLLLCGCVNASPLLLRIRYEKAANDGYIDTCRGEVTSPLRIRGCDSRAHFVRLLLLVLAL